MISFMTSIVSTFPVKNVSVTFPFFSVVVADVPDSVLLGAELSDALLSDAVLTDVELLHAVTMPARRTTLNNNAITRFISYPPSIAQAYFALRFHCIPTYRRLIFSYF